MQMNDRAATVRHLGVSTCEKALARNVGGITQTIHDRNRVTSDPERGVERPESLVLVPIIGVVARSRANLFVIEGEKRKKKKEANRARLQQQQQRREQGAEEEATEEREAALHIDEFTSRPNPSCHCRSEESLNPRTVVYDIDEKSQLSAPLSLSISVPMQHGQSALSLRLFLFDLPPPASLSLSAFCPFLVSYRRIYRWHRSVHCNEDCLRY